MHGREARTRQLARQSPHAASGGAGEQTPAFPQNPTALPEYLVLTRGLRTHVIERDAVEGSISIRQVDRRGARRRHVRVSTGDQILPIPPELEALETQA